MGALQEPGAATTMCAKDREITGDAAIVCLAIRTQRSATPKARLCRPCCCAVKKWGRTCVHDVEAFGPISTLMPYQRTRGRDRVANRGKGSLVMRCSATTPASSAMSCLARRHHGRIAFIDRDSAKESTGHGSPMPHMIHGGPGRAGGGEEMGGIRGVIHYMQRTALQGRAHAFRDRASLHRRRADQWWRNIRSATKFHDLPIGYQLTTKAREITLTISSTSRTSPATPSTRTWTRKRRAPIRCLAAASRMVISSSLSPPVSSSIPIQARCWRTTGSTICAS